MHDTGKYIGVNIAHPDIDYVHMAAAYGIEGEKVTDPEKLTAALNRCQQSMQAGKPYLVDVRIRKYGVGSDSQWYDFYSIAKGIPRQS